MAKRETISGPEIPEHYKRFPTAVKVGNMVFSSNVGGEDSVTHEVPGDIEQQIKNAFQNVRSILARAGGTVGDIGKFQVALKSMDDRSLMNKEWIAMLPDENDRPVRHTVAEDLSGGRLIAIEFIAVL
jgi:enamine deaminase RidA (YjgF/YER057c/UK114 family)